MICNLNCVVMPTEPSHWVTRKAHQLVMQIYKTWILGTRMTKTGLLPVQICDYESKLQYKTICINVFSVHIFILKVFIWTYTIKVKCFINSIGVKVHNLNVCNSVMHCTSPNGLWNLWVVETILDKGHSCTAAGHLNAHTRV